MIELELPEIEAFVARMAAQARFAVHDHRADLYGDCRDCT